VARFDVYANPDANERKVIPYLLDVQNDYLNGLESRVVVPLRSASLLQLRAKGLNPELEVTGKAVVMETAAIGAIPTGELRRPVANLARDQLTIQDALDTLFGSH
jgi:toxin CcdB